MKQIVLNAFKLTNMSKLKNRQLTENFKLFEFLFPENMPKLSHEMNITHLQNNPNDFVDVILNAQKIAKVLQEIRNNLNEKYNQKIRIRINSGYRCPEWEFHRGRNGKSQHVKGHAVDFVIVCENSQKIMNELYEELNKNFVGGVACKRETRNGTRGVIVFIHLDLRGHEARWSY